MEENKIEKEKESQQSDIQQENKEPEGTGEGEGIDFQKPVNTLNRTKALQIEEFVEKDTKEEIKYPINLEDVDELESEEEQDTPTVQEPLSKEENYTLKNLLVPKFSFNELTQPQLTKIYDLKVLTEEAIAKTVKNKQSSNIVKALVSKKKNRFCYDGFDLDLTYITTKKIAMGLPFTSLEGLNRNPMEEVQKFFNTRHPSHYKIYNLCEEKNYPQNTFYKQGYFPFKDHEAPPLNLMRNFAKMQNNL